MTSMPLVATARDSLSKEVMPHRTLHAAACVRFVLMLNVSFAICDTAEIKRLVKINKTSLFKIEHLTESDKFTSAVLFAHEPCSTCEIRGNSAIAPS